MLHAVTRLPDANSHSCRMLRTNAPCDTMPDVSWLACDPARCVHWAARGPDSSGRWACSMACGNDADFSAADGFCRDAHIDIRREVQRQTRPRRRSKLHVAAQTRTDACRLDGRPCAELAGRGSGGHRSHRPMKAGGGGSARARPGSP